MSSSKGVTVESVNSIDAGMMREGRGLFELWFKILGLWQAGYFAIVGFHGDDVFQPEIVTRIKHAPTVDANGSTSTNRTGFVVLSEQGGTHSHCSTQQVCR